MYEDNFMSIIYKITNSITGQLYVGKTHRTINERFSDHKQNSKKGTTYLYSAMRKYGLENFVMSLLEECDESISNDREIFWISELNCLAPVGYNMSAGGTGGDNSTSPNFVEAMKIYHFTKPKEEYATFGNAGKKHSDNTKLQQSIARQKHWDSLTDDCRKDRSKKITGSKNGMFGKTPSNAVRIRYQGVEYQSLAEAARILRISPKRIKSEGNIIK
jgi:group I intron endonuclease